MRRKDREITNKEILLGILKKESEMVVGVVDNYKVYQVVLNYTCVVEGEETVLYFHSATEGKKLDLFRQQVNVNFVIYRSFGLHDVNNENITTHYYSIFGEGVVNELVSLEEKKEGLVHFISKYNKELKFPDSVLQQVYIGKIIIKEMTGKSNMEEIKC